ncbi:MAG: hypothetical protein GXY52_11745 [Chloroflexi bacterium]|nr:hypothetical protein [Chloroflexota bacterium]
MLLFLWSIPPGTREDGTFSEEAFQSWYSTAIQICKESNYMVEAMTALGGVLTYVPEDPSGFWINRAVASVLDTELCEALCSRFIFKKRSSLGVHFVDPTGESERELANYYSDLAIKTREASFFRLAVKLDLLAEHFRRESKRIHKTSGD